MSKGKYERKRDRAKQRKQQEASATAIPNGVIHPEGETKTPAEGQKKTDAKKEKSVRVRELIERSSLTDWLLAIFTAVLAAAAIYQFVITDAQLTEMRKDERPWVKLTFDGFVAQANAPIGGTFHIVNIGKTVAKNLLGSFTIEKVQNGEQPTLDFGRAWNGMSSGALFPNDPAVQFLTKQQAVHHPSGDTYEPDILNQADFDDFNNGKIFFVAYAYLPYSDFSHIQHWTKYCTFLLPAQKTGTATARSCTDYNNVDDN
jgi:hypothetical protein